MRPLAGWGGFPRVDGELLEPATTQDARRAATLEGSIARGNGRSYGDAAIGLLGTVSLRGLDRMRSFDPSTGRLSVEAGVLLSDIVEAFLPRGFFPPVVPGTRFVTVGGAIAADVHGKNHHRDGGFGAHVEDIELALPSGEVVCASRQHEAGLFAATCGGMGLTGTILSATLRLRPVETGWIRQTTVVAPDLASALAAIDAGDDATYCVGWIDALAKGPALGRSLIFFGEHATAGEIGERARFPVPAAPRLTVPVDLPGFTLNRLSVAAFNALYFRNGARKAGAPQLVPAGPYFFPLDGVGAWNRIYGRRGFVQHQCVLPPGRAAETLAAILERVSARGDASFLAVIKKLGPAAGPLSFPMPGYTLALDFRVTPDLFAFLDGLDALVAEAGGRLYLAKDARQSRATFEAGYPELGAFRDIRRSVDPQARLRSLLAVRLGL